MEKEDDSKGIGNNEMALNNMVLPEEMLQKIFSYLSGQKDLSTVMLVCKTWNNVAEGPVFWSWLKITKPSQLAFKRLQGASKLLLGSPGPGTRKEKSQTSAGEGPFNKFSSTLGLKRSPCTRAG